MKYDIQVDQYSESRNGLLGKINLLGIFFWPLDNNSDSNCYSVRRDIQKEEEKKA